MKKKREIEYLLFQYHHNTPHKGSLMRYDGYMCCVMIEDITIEQAVDIAKVLDISIVVHWSADWMGLWDSDDTERWLWKSAA